ncbi:hypothetical protein HDV00_005410 [Rhizophlyctis rosea]|nr:hypothetical protein HDV00_005410 [Rhizophlyctis rosea]
MSAPDENFDAKLAILLNIFDTVPDISILQKALVAAGGDVEQAIATLLDGENSIDSSRNIRDEEQSVGKSFKRKSIVDFFKPEGGVLGKRARTDGGDVVSGVVGRTSNTQPPSPSTVKGKSSPSNPYPSTDKPSPKNAYEALFKAVDKPEEDKQLPPKELNASIISDHVPCELILNALPDELAASLLERMLDESKTWTVRRFVLFDREVQSPHTSCFYKEPTTSAPSANARYTLPDTDIYYGGRSIEDVRVMPPEAVIARNHVERIVNQRMALRELASGGRHEAEIVGRWRPNIVLGNCYRGWKEGVGAHTDKLTYLGPRPTIGSITLGATRTFRMRRFTVPGRPQPQTYNVLLPHNSLLIMFPPMQEEYRHSVPQTTEFRLTPHPISNETRINLTFRVVRREYHESIPLCSCGNPAELRSVVKQPQTLGRYFYMCATGGNEERGVKAGHNCGFFSWLDLEGMNRTAREYSRVGDEEGGESNGGAASGEG